MTGNNRGRVGNGFGVGGGDRAKLHNARGTEGEKDSILASLRQRLQVNQRRDRAGPREEKGMLGVRRWGREGGGKEEKTQVLCPQYSGIS